MGTVDRSQEPLVSIIVPIYNVEKYLKKCVDSIINQTYKNLEIILVDDGSPDLCGEICDEYVKMDKRIKVIHKINGGLSDARNAGLNIMQGQYVGFVDSDDWIEPNMYARLIENLIDFNADISIGGVTNLLESENGYKILRTTQKDEIINWSCDKEEAMECYFLGTWSAWDKIYKKTIFKDLRFPKGEINEDEAIALQILEQCDVISYTNEAVYNYIKRGNSITTSKFNKDKLLWFKHCRDNLEYVNKKHMSLRQAAEVRFFSSISWSLNHMLYQEDEYKIEIKEMRSILKSNMKKIIKNSLIFKKEKIKLVAEGYFWGIFKIYIKKMKRVYD